MPLRAVSRSLRVQAKTPSISLPARSSAIGRLLDCRHGFIVMGAPDAVGYREVACRT